MIGQKEVIMVNGYLYEKTLSVESICAGFLAF